MCSSFVASGSQICEYLYESLKNYVLTLLLFEVDVRYDVFRCLTTKISTSLIAVLMEESQ